MEFKGTKGEWLADALIDDGIMLRDENCTRDIATIWRYEDSFLEKQEMQANAKLIACAPEMLKMLIKMRYRFDNIDLELEELITKATTI